MTRNWTADDWAVVRQALCATDAEHEDAVSTASDDSSEGTQACSEQRSWRRKACAALARFTPSVAVEMHPLYLKKALREKARRKVVGKAPRAARRRIEKDRHVLRSVMQNAVANSIEVKPQDDGDFLMFSPETLDPLRLTPEEAENMVMEQIRDGLCTRHSLMLDKFYSCKDASGIFHGILYARVASLEQMVVRRDIKFDFMSMRMASMLSPRIKAGVLATGVTRHVLVVINLQLHPRNHEKDENGMFALPGNFGLLVLHPLTRCSYVRCPNTVEEGEDMPFHKQGGFQYCSKKCMHQDAPMRKHLLNFMRTNLHVHTHPAALRRAESGCEVVVEDQTET